MYKVLLVDDEGIVLDSLKFIINKNFGESCEIRTAKTGRQAIEIAQEFVPDISFMDIQMPLMNGYEAAAAIRNLDDNVKAATPIIAMTANAFAEDVILAKNAGMNEHMAKPIDINKLNDILKKWL